MRGRDRITFQIGALRPLPGAEIRRFRAYKTSRTFTATMKQKTTSSGVIGTRSVWDSSFDLGLPVSSACADVSSRMIRKRMRDATAAAPKLPARNVDVTVTTVVIIPATVSCNLVEHVSTYLKPSPTRRVPGNGTEIRHPDHESHRFRRSSRPLDSA